MNNGLRFERREIESSIVARWQRIVHCFSNRTAVIDFGGDQHTFSELDQASNSLTQALLNQLGEDNYPVILLLEHSKDLIVAILGALKAHKAYVALDPRQTVDQLKQLSQITAAPLIVTDRRYHELAECIGASDKQVWTIDCLPSCERMLADPAVFPDSAAGIFFTSGTINQPKGVARTHRMILHRTWYSAAICQFGPGHRISGVRQSGLGSGVADLFNALLNGATYCIYPLRTEGLHGLTEWLNNRKITYFHPPIALYRQWLDTLVEDEFFPHMRHILPSGRKSKDDVTRIWRHVPVDCVILTSYSSTETTQISCRVLDRRTLLTDGILDVGQTLPDKRVLVVDEDGDPVSMGEVGEFTVQSRYISSGYWRQPELTAERFELAPDGSGEIIYRTGDFGWQRPDGGLELIGRQDSQVKVRGYRVLLDEVEDALLELPAISQAAVTADEEQGILYAHIVAADDPPVPADGIRQALVDRVPEYCIPAHFIYLSDLPLLPSGKINRRALPMPVRSRPYLSTPFAAPGNALEMQLRTIWEALLGIDEIGVQDNFFDLGGHSLLATQLVSRVRDNLRVELPLRALFEHPTIAEIALAIESGSDDQVLEPIEAKARSGKLPLSFGEERLWFLHQLEPDSPNYTIHRAYRLTGSLDEDTLEKSFAELIRRHESPRTTYKMQNGTPFRVISENCSFSLPITDITARATSEQEETVRQQIEQEGRFRFSLEDGPLFQVRLLRLSLQEHVLFITQHHIVSDAWSTSVLWRELEILYRAYCRQESSPLPDLPIQYADYAHWQRMRQDEIYSRQLTYWKNQLQDSPSRLELHTDYARPEQPNYRGTSALFTMPAALTDAINTLARQEKCTSFMTLLAAFYVLLFRYSSQEDIVVGTPVANRSTSQVEGLIGFFLNTLALRINLSGSDTFLQLLSRVRKVSLDAYQHQDLPFEKLVAELEPERLLNRHPLFDVLFMLRDAGSQNFSLVDLVVTQEPKERETVMYDLRVALEECEGHLVAEWHYDTDLFEASSITRMASQFQTLLESIVANPKLPIHTLPILTTAEQQEMLSTWNEAALAEPLDRCVHQLFEVQVVSTPDLPAIETNGISITYADLNRRSNQMARLLRIRGICPNDPIVLFVESDVAMLIAMLAIFKAGGIYVPLDPNLPIKRLESIFAHVRPKAFLYRNSHDLALLPSDGEFTRVHIDDIQSSTQPEGNLVAQNTLHDAAYILFTSGSTGRPKAVQVPHRTLANLVLWQKHHPRLGKPARTLQISSLTFDVSLQEILTTWAVGGTLVLSSSDLRKDPHQLLHSIAELQIERLFMPYVLVQALADCTVERLLNPAQLRDIISAGETLRLTPSIRTLMKKLPRCRLHNHYGPTESHVVTAHTLTRESDQWLADAPIGSPIANTQIYLFDSHLQIMPIGVPGELYIGGAGLALGYLNQPDLTAEHFIPHPFSDDPGARLYRTGDLVRYRNDGTLEFLGRHDDQIKLRGFRIEPGEIETVLTRHPDVQTAIVIMRQDMPNDQRIVAYVVPTTGGPGVDIADLRALVSATLPRYMVPAAFVVMQELPHTTQGKIDRIALPAPDNSERSSSAPHVPPKSPEEEAIAAIWRDVLGFDEIGIHDNFFELGGHSLLAIRIVSRVEQYLHVHLPVRTIFEYPTIFGIAATLHPATATSGSVMPEEKDEFII